MTFGLAAATTPTFGKTRAIWYRSAKEFDDEKEIREKIGPLIDAAVAGELELEWMKTPESGIAHITLLDQFTRNTKRATAGAWSGDERGLRNALDMIYSGKYAQLPQVMQAMTLMPLMRHDPDASNARRTHRDSGVVRVPLR